MTVEPRELSPVSGTSILMTSAPRSAISMYGTVPACAVEQATTFTPCSGPYGSVISNVLASCFNHLALVIPAEARLAVFCCFGRKLTAGGIPFLAEILGYRRFGNRENSGMLGCFRCFLLYLIFS